MTTGADSQVSEAERPGQTTNDARNLDESGSNELKEPERRVENPDDHERRVRDEDFRLAVKKLLSEVQSLPENWTELTVREQRNWVKLGVRELYPNLPDNLIALCLASTIKGDCQRPADEVPEWLDREKFKRGQRFAMENLAGISIAEMLSLFMLFSFDYGLKPLIITGKSSEPFTSFKRYLSTTKRIRSWYSSDVWTAGTEGQKDMQAVRRMHANIRKRLSGLSHEEIDEAARIDQSWSSMRNRLRQDFRESVRAPAPGQCPYMFSEDEQHKRPQGLNQGEMSGTQFGFMGLVILYPEKFGIHGASEEDLDAYCHLWRGLGYLLGIEDEFNFCNGTLDEVRQRTREFLEYWIKSNFREITPEWEHMMRCVIEGIMYYFPAMTYEQSLLFLADVIGIDMPRLRASLSYRVWVRYNLMKFTFGWTARLPGFRKVMNRTLTIRIDKALKFTDEKLEELRKRSDATMAKGIAETQVAKKELSLATPTLWQKAPFLVISSAILLLNLPIIVKEYAEKLLRIGSDASGIPN